MTPDAAVTTPPSSVLCWGRDLISENVERKKADLFEELCIEEDQPGATYAEVTQLMGPKRRRV